MAEEDWVLHISVQGCHFQSCDIRTWHEICGTVPNRILHAAGIELKYTRVGNDPEASKNQREDELKIEDV